MDWKEISNNRLQKDHPLGFIIVKPKNVKSPVPFFCPVCKAPMKDAQDAWYFRQYECCTNCGIEFAEPNRKKWMDGWRPNED